MELADILLQDSVIICPDRHTKADVLQKLAEVAASATGIPVETIYAALAEREALGSTGLGNGIAVPHGKLVGLPAVTAAFALLRQPVDFDAIDDQPVDLVMLLLAPVGAGADHLKALSRVARLLRSEAKVQELRAADSAAQLHALLTQSAETTRAA